MTAYKVNFKKFVSKVLEKDLPDISLMDEGIGIHLSKFTD